MELGREAAHVVVHDGQAPQVIRIVGAVAGEKVGSRLVHAAERAAHLGAAHEAFPAPERGHAGALDLGRRLLLGVGEARPELGRIGRDRPATGVGDPAGRRLLATGPLGVGRDRHEDRSRAGVARVLDHGAQLSEVRVDPELDVFGRQERLGRGERSGPGAEPEGRRQLGAHRPRHSLERRIEVRSRQDPVEAQGERQLALDSLPIPLGVEVHVLVIADIKDENVPQRAGALRRAQPLQELALDEVDLPRGDPSDRTIDHLHILAARGPDPALERARERAVLRVPVARDGALSEDEDARRRAGSSAREEAIDHARVGRPVAGAVGGRAEERRVEPLHVDRRAAERLEVADPGDSRRRFGQSEEQEHARSREAELLRRRERTAWDDVARRGGSADVVHAAPPSGVTTSKFFSARDELRVYPASPARPRRAIATPRAACSNGDPKCVSSDLRPCSRGAGIRSAAVSFATRRARMPGWPGSGRIPASSTSCAAVG